MNWIDWSPKEAVLSTIEEILHDAIMPNNEVQKNVHKKIEAVQNQGDFTHYLMYILGHSGYSNDLRALSGILLKNCLQQNFLLESELVFLKNESLKVLTDPVREVRASCSNVIAIICVIDHQNWRDIVGHLLKLFMVQDEHSEMALITLCKICEDLLGVMDEQEFKLLIKEVFPKFFQAISNEFCWFNCKIVHFTNQLLQDHFILMKESINLALFLQIVIDLANTDNADMLCNICHTFVIYMNYQDESLLPHLQSIINFLLEKSQHENCEIALQASEFWLSCSHVGGCTEFLGPFIERLVPILLNNMKYSEFELMALKDSVGEDSNIMDASKDIKPTFLKSRTNNNTMDDDFEEEAPNLDEFSVGWTLRKCSAASLDALSLRFKDEFLNVLIPLLESRLYHEDFLMRESAILALGAVSEGCLQGLSQFLPQMLHFLFESLNDDNALIRAITCWSLGRFVFWALNKNDSSEDFFVPLMSVLLKHSVDKNKSVQRAAISAFSIFEEEAGFKLVPYVEFILEAFKIGLLSCQMRSLFLLYDALGILAQAVGNVLSKPEFAEQIMGPLIQKFVSSKDFYSEHFVLLLGCFANVIPALEEAFLPYSEVVFVHCLQVVNETLLLQMSYLENPQEQDLPDKDPMNVALDVLCSMAIGLKNNFVKFVTNSNLIALLTNAMQDSCDSIRQTAISLYGELVTISYSFLQDNIHGHLRIIIKSLNIQHEGVCNNAAWVVGKLALAMGSSIQNYLPEIIPALLSILQTPKEAQILHKTVAVALCSIFFVCPDISLESSEEVLRTCCHLIRNVRDSEQKDLAFRGLCQIVLKNPNFMSNNFYFFCDAAASWKEVQFELKTTVCNVLGNFQNKIGQEVWNHFYAQFPDGLKVKLNGLYGV